MGNNVTSMGKISRDQDGQELKKHAAIIHCANTLSLLQRKICNALLYHAYSVLLTEEEHIISIRDLCRLIHYQGNNYDAIKDALRGLIATVIEWNLVDNVGGTEDWSASTMLAGVNLRRGKCTYSYSPQLKKLLYSPSMFGRVSLVMQARFKSGYGLALYENCVRYRELRFSKWFELALFRKLMGVPRDQYPIFRDFKRRVLDKAVAEVNAFTDIQVDPELKRLGRAVVKIRFALKTQTNDRNIEASLDNTLPSVAVPGLEHKLINTYGLNKKIAHKIVREYGHDFIEHKLSELEKAATFRNPQIRNRGGYLVKILATAYDQAISALSVPQPVVANEQCTAVMIEHDRRNRQEAFREYREQLVEEVFQGLSAEFKQELHQKFLSETANTIETILRLQNSRYRRENIMQSPQMKALFRAFVIRELNVISMTMDEFIAVHHSDSKKSIP